MGCFDFIQECIDYLFRNQEIEGKISAYKSLSPQERSQLNQLLYQRNKLRELKLLIYQILVVYETGTSEDRANIEKWLIGIGANEALEEIQKRFVTNAIGVR